jgi:hypothetical protein
MKQKIIPAKTNCVEIQYLFWICDIRVVSKTEGVRRDSVVL